MSNRFAVILAAGQGTRMKSNLHKVLHRIGGRPMIQHVIEQLRVTHLEQMITVIGHGANEVAELIGSESRMVLQQEQLGTAHAVLQAEESLRDQTGTTVVVCGDTPLITSETYQALFDYHEKTGAKATVLTAEASDPAGYGRIVRNSDGEVSKIVEHKDADDAELQIKEINTGTYCFDNQALFEALRHVSNDNSQGEYYLPDVIEILQNNGERISAYQTDDISETIGINDRVALAEAEKNLKNRINKHHMQQGVTLIDPDHTYIEPDVTIEADVLIHPGAVIKGQTTIKQNAEIGPHTEINDSFIGEESHIDQSVVENSYVGDRVQAGPYAHIRPESTIEHNVKLGNFVEIKKSTIGQKSKVPHLSYVGDAQVGSNVNIGCGAITVNYDGNNKYTTTIEDDAFIGCNANLIAPVTVKKGAYVAAGSTINQSVPEESLGIARSRQTNKEGYAARLKNQEKS